MRFARLPEVASRAGAGRRNLALITGLPAVLPVFMKRPGGMVEEQAAEGKEPQEENQKQAGIKMQPAIPALEARPQARAVS